MKKMSFLLSVILLSSASLFAQTNSKDVSDTELANFAEAFQEVQEISQQSQQKMVETIEDESLNLQRYNAIARAQQSGEDLEVSEDEIEKIQAINSKLMEIDSESNELLQKKISDSNLTVERYQEIMELMQSDEQLQIRLQEHLQN